MTSSCCSFSIDSLSVFLHFLTYLLPFSRVNLKLYIEVSQNGVQQSQVTDEVVKRIPLLTFLAAIFNMTKYLLAEIEVRLSSYLEFTLLSFFLGAPILMRPIIPQKKLFAVPEIDSTNYMLLTQSLLTNKI